MKFRELKGNQPLEVIEVSRYLSVPPSPGRRDEKKLLKIL